jgi:mannose-6-phosphate isomerase-like protein (cupin superfamily)
MLRCPAAKRSGLEARAGRSPTALMSSLAPRQLAPAPDAIAPDGSEVRLLASLPRGSMAHFTLAPGAVTRAVAHRSVEEVWFFVGGRGRMWRRFDGEEVTVDVFPGVSIAIPTGAAFQFRADGDEPLRIVGVTMPPWPGEAEAYPVDGIWPPTI